jgi:hypothetical protein
VEVRAFAESVLRVWSHNMQSYGWHVDDHIDCLFARLILWYKFELLSTASSWVGKADGQLCVEVLASSAIQPPTQASGKRHATPRYILLVNLGNPHGHLQPSGQLDVVYDCFQQWYPKGLGFHGTSHLKQHFKSHSPD